MLHSFALFMQNIYSYFGINVSADFSFGVTILTILTIFVLFSVSGIIYIHRCKKNAKEMTS